VSFQGKLILLFISLFLCSAALMLLFYTEMKIAVVNSLQDAIEDVVHSVHYSTQKLSAEKAPDKEFLEDFIKNAKKNGAVNEISVVGSDNRIVASSNPRKVGKKRTVTDQITVVREEFGNQDSLGKHDHYRILVPIERGNKVVGVVQTNFVINDMGTVVHQFFIKYMIIAISALLLLFSVSFIALRKMNRPISLLCRASEKIAQGDDSVQINYKGSDELSKLISAFNSMALKINEQRLLEERFREMERRAILSETAASLAHELRNPLNLINLTVDYLKDKFKPGNPDQENEYTELMKNVKNEVQRLNRMVGDFLTMGKPLKLQKTRFALKELVSDVEVLLKRQLVSLHIKLIDKTSEELLIDGDREQLRLVILNLLLNAIQAVGEGGWINISTEIESDFINITVTDNGPGIPQADLEKIFEPYFSTKPDGTGLGLALSKRIVEAHNGSISVSNKDEGGASFEIKLPPGGNPDVQNTDC